MDVWVIKEFKTYGNMGDKVLSVWSSIELANEEALRLRAVNDSIDLDIDKFIIDNPYNIDNLFNG